MSLEKSIVATEEFQFTELESVPEAMPVIPNGPIWEGKFKAKMQGAAHKLLPRVEEARK